MLRRLVRLAVLAAPLLVLAACDPAPVPRESERAHATVRVGPTGNVRIELSLSPDHEPSLRPTAEKFAETLFPGRPARVTIDGNDGGYSFAVISLPDFFDPGRRPTAQLAVGNPAKAVLREAGISGLDLHLCPPYVPNRIQSSIRSDSEAAPCTFWRTSTDPAAPVWTATMTLRPDPGRWYRSIALTIVTLLSFAAAVPRAARMRPPVDAQCRLRGVLRAGPGILAFGIGAATLAAAPHGDNLGATGRLDGWPLWLATHVPLLLILAGVGCVMAAIVSLVAGRQPARAQDGWPPQGKPPSRPS